MSFVGRPIVLVRTAEKYLRSIRIYWLPCVLAMLPFFLLTELSQLQEYVRVIIFDFNAHVASVCVTAFALFALICSLYRACGFASVKGGRSTTADALISFSPVAAMAAATYLAASEISGTLFQPERRAAFLVAAALMLAFPALVTALHFLDRWKYGFEKLITLVPHMAFAICAAALLLPFGPPPTIVTVAQTVGPIGLVLSFCLLVVTVSTFLAGLAPSIRRLFLLASVCGAFAFSYLNWNANHTVRALPGDSAFASGDLKSLFAEWYNARADRAQFDGYPVYIVATAGGGYYAAYHAALVLARLQDQCDNFAQHVFAVSGVSGGSLGAGVFSSLVDRLAPQQVTGKCGQSSGRKYVNAVEEYFKNDFLSPILFYALGSDLFQRFLPFPVKAYDRALGLEYAIEQAWLDAERVSGLPQGENPLRAGFRQRWSNTRAAPALVLNTTRVDTGQRILFSPFRLLVKSPIWSEPAQTAWQLGLRNDLRTSTAIGLSARFPIVSPAGEFNGVEFDWSLKQHPRRVGLVDGGYFENSGTATAMDLFFALDGSVKENKLPVNLRLIVVGGIDGVFDELLGRMTYGTTARGALKQEADDFVRLGDALSGHVPRSSRSAPVSGELASPISALLGTCADQGKQAISRGWLTLMARSLEREEDSSNSIDDLVPMFGLSEANIPFPLSWVVSRPVRQRIAARTSSKGCVDEPFQEIFLAQKRHQLENDWRVKLLSEYGEDLRFIVELSRAACGIAAVHRALSATVGEKK